MGRTCSYSWASWKSRWDKVDWEVSDYRRNFLFNRKRRAAFNKYGNDRATMLDYQMAGLISSWAIRFDYAEYINHAYTVYPSYTKSFNIGMDGSGVHNKKSNSGATHFELTTHDYQLMDELQ